MNECIEFQFFSDNTVIVKCEVCRTELTFKAKKRNLESVMTPELKEFLETHDSCIATKH